MYLLRGHSLTRYVDKTRQVGGTGNVNGMQRFYLIIVKYVNRG